MAGLAAPTSDPLGPHVYEATRRRGFAGALLDWLLNEARRLGCDQFHLDSGVQAERKDAHRLYFNKNMRISAYHFETVVNP